MKRVVVIGGGVMGSAAAWQLASRGIDVTLLEQFRPGHTNGSSHGSSRIFRLAYPDPFYVTLAARALPLWRQVEYESGQAVLTLTGAVDHGPARRPRRCTPTLRKAGHPSQVLRTGRGGSSAGPACGSTPACSTTRPPAGSTPTTRCAPSSGPPRRRERRSSTACASPSLRAPSTDRVEVVAVDGTRDRRRRGGRRGRRLGARSGRRQRRRTAAAAGHAGAAVALPGGRGARVAELHPPRRVPRSRRETACTGSAASTASRSASTPSVRSSTRTTAIARSTRPRARAVQDYAAELAARRRPRRRDRDHVPVHDHSGPRLRHRSRRTGHGAGRILGPRLQVRLGDRRDRGRPRRGRTAPSPLSARKKSGSGG